MGRLDDLKTELDTDPQARGYAGMGDAAAAADINTVYRTRNFASLTGSEVLNAIDKAEFNALSAVDQQRVWDVLHLGTINPFGLEATLFTDIFGGGSATITALLVIRKEDVSRGVELGLGFVGHADVQDARAI